MKKLSEHQIQYLEKVLGFELYDYQKALLTNGEYTLPRNRHSGRTLTLMLKQLLLEDKISFTPRSFISDSYRMPYETSALKYEHWYRRELQDLAKKLNDNGIATAKIIDEESW